MSLDSVSLSLQAPCVCALTLQLGSLIVVHGAGKCSLESLNDSCHDSMFKRTPANTRLLEYDVNVDLSEKFRWKDIQDRSTGLVQAMCMEYKDIKVRHTSLLPSPLS